jgi:hypothetical protein
MQLAFDLKRSDVLQLADEYWGLISPRDRELELLLEKELPGSRAKGYLTRSVFLDIARWKSPRPRRLHEANSPMVIRAATRASFDASSDSAAVEPLCTLKGVRLRTASALLQWMRPDRFPILDVRVVNSLGEAPPNNWEETAFYTRIADGIRTIAKELGVDLRTLDRALWALDKKRSKGSKNHPSVLVPS